MAKQQSYQPRPDVQHTLEMLLKTGKSPLVQPASLQPSVGAERERENVFLHLKLSRSEVNDLQLSDDNRNLER